MAGKTLYPKDFYQAVSNKRTAGAYLFSGGSEEDIQDAIARLKAALVGPAFESLNYTLFAGREAGLDEILSAARTQAFGAGGRLVVLREPKALSAEGHDRLVAYFKEPEPGNCLVVVADDLDWRHRLVKGAQEAGVKVDFKTPTWIKRGEVVAEGLKRAGLEADAGARQALEALLPEDRGLMNRELEKLALYLGERRRVTREDLGRILINRSSAAAAQLSEAVGRRDIPRALHILDRLLEEGEAPQKLIWSLAADYRLLLMARLVAAGRREGSDLAELWKREKWGKAPSEEKLRDFIDCARRFTTDELGRSLLALREADRLLKSTALPPALVLEALLAGRFSPDLPGRWA